VQAVALLRNIQPLTGHGVYVFHGVRSALYALGFGKEQSWHGFRASARTMLVDEMNLDPLAIEANLWQRLALALIQVPQAAVELAKQFEGFHRTPKQDPERAYPYVCPAGFWTIGYGHLCATDQPPITRDQAEAYLIVDMKIALRATLRYCPVLTTVSDNRLAAMVDFTFNLGGGRLQASTLRRKVNRQDWSGATQELSKWVHGGGKVLPGLVLRRQAEAAMLR
jgi:lysozyme